MTDDRSESDAARPGSRKTKPPVIELTATDVTPEQAKQEMKEEQAAPREKRAAPESNPQPEAPERVGRSPFFFAALAGGIGLLSGALVLALVLLFTGNSPERAASAEKPSLAAQLAKSADIDKRVSTLEADWKNLDASALKSRLEKIETSVSDLKKSFDEAQTGFSKSTDAISEQLNSLDARVKQGLSRPPVANAAEIVALGNLQDAIAKGTAFKKELDAVRAMLGEGGNLLAPLEAQASSGLPTMNDLRKRFSDLAPKLAHEPKNNGGYFSRLLSSAGRLVEVRPVGEVQGASAGAVVARIETRLARNDLAEALQETKQLPDSAKAQAADWIASASRRHEADVAVKNLLDASLARAKVEPKK